MPDRVRQRRQRGGARRGPLGGRAGLRRGRLHDDRDRDRRWRRRRRPAGARRSSIPSTATSASGGGPTTTSPASARTTATASRASRPGRRSPPAPVAARRALGPEHPVWVDVASELGELMAVLVLALSPQRIVIGGGVGYGQRWLLPRVREATLAALAGYVAAVDAASIESLIVPAGLGDDAGPLGVGRHRRSTPSNDVGSAADEHPARRSRAAGGAIPFSEFQRLALYGPDGLLHPRRRRAGRPPRRRVPHLAGGRAAVRRRARPLPRRRSGTTLGRPEPFTVVDAGAGPGTLARSILAARPACLAAMRYVAVEVSAAQRALHPGRSRVAARPSGRAVRRRHRRQRVARQPARSGCACSTEHGARRSSSPPTAAFGEVLSAPLDPPPPCLPPAPAHGSRAPLHDAAVAWVADARSRLRRGRLLAVDYARPTTPSLAAPAVAGVAAHVPRPRTRRPLPRRSRRPGHHRRGRPRPVPRARRRGARRRSSCGDGASTSSSPRASGSGRPAQPPRTSRAHGDAQPRRSRPRRLLDPAGLGAFLAVEWSGTVCAA